ncbi:NUDIX domain-containing protein [Streptomyces sp. BE20]|uniref:NUDIX domain-containing protein n=1 Tax=Streptomyces sp. BE20 TaxID=3002525 RepID=UPI003FA74BD4
MGALIVRHGRLLMLRRTASDSWAGRWEPPGGVETGESLAEALAREVQEEEAGPAIASAVHRPPGLPSPREPPAASRGFFFAAEEPPGQWPVRINQTEHDRFARSTADRVRSTRPDLRALVTRRLALTARSGAGPPGDRREGLGRPEVDDPSERTLRAGTDGGICWPVGRPSRHPRPLPWRRRRPHRARRPCG